MGEEFWKHCLFAWLSENFADTLGEGNAEPAQRSATRLKSYTTPEQVPLAPALSARQGALFSVHVKWRSERLTRSYLRDFVVDPFSLEKYFGTCGDSHNSGCLVSCWPLPSGSAETAVSALPLDLPAPSVCASEFSHQRQAASSPVENTVVNQHVSVGGAVVRTQVGNLERVLSTGECRKRARRSSESARALELLHVANSKKSSWSSAAEEFPIRRVVHTAERACESARAPQLLRATNDDERVHPQSVRTFETRVGADSAQCENRNQESASPLLMPIRAFLDDVKSLKRGDIHIGRGSRQRNLTRSLFANPFKVSAFGRDAAVDRFADHLLGPEPEKRSTHSLREKAALPLHGKAKVSR